MNDTVPTPTQPDDGPSQGDWTDAHRTLDRIAALVAPDSPIIEARMDRAANVDSDVVRAIRHLLDRERVR